MRGGRSKHFATSPNGMASSACSRYNA